MSISIRLSELHKQIIDAENNFGRKNGDVHLLAVSKTFPAAAIQQAYNEGQRAFGENYCQEALEKIHALGDLPIEWHFIGPIQSNKTRLISQHFSWVESIDRLKIAQRLNDHRPDELPALNVCIQVNLQNEPSKSGVTLSELEPLCLAIQHMPKLRLRGFMAIPKKAHSLTEQRISFKPLHDAFIQLKARFHLDTLSIGMSNDFPAAIAEGSTLIRIGSALFGQRQSQEQGEL